MTKVILSTVRRHVHPSEPSGCFYIVDLEKQCVLQRCEMIEPPHRELDTNPRGGLRGSRGISVRPDQIALANAAAVFRYDPQWNLLGITSHPSASAIHDIMIQGDELWATSARNDLVLKFTLTGDFLGFYNLREPSLAKKQLRWRPPLMMKPSQVQEGRIDFRNPRTHQAETYDHAHVNSIGFLTNGKPLVSLGMVIDLRYATLLWLKSQLIQRGIWDRFIDMNRKISEGFRLRRKNFHSDLVIQPAKARSAIWWLSAQGNHSLSMVIPSMTVPSHSLSILHDDSAVYLNTTQGCVVHFDPISGETFSSTMVTEGYLRGVTQLSERKLLLGSKTELILFDLLTQKVEQTFKISDVPHEAVYDIKVLPGNYAMPPESFEQHFKLLTGHRAADLIREGGILTSRDVVG